MGLQTVTDHIKSREKWIKINFDWWHEGGKKTKKTQRHTCIRSCQQRRLDSRVLLTRVDGDKWRWDQNGQERLKKMARCVLLCLTGSFTPRRKRMQVCQSWRESGFAARSSCVASLCPCERVLSIQAPWESCRLKLHQPHLSWPLSLSYRSPSPGHWCIFICVMTRLWKGSLA